MFKPYSGSKGALLFFVTQKKTPSGVSQLGEISYQGASTNLNLLGVQVILRKNLVIFSQLIFDL
ncbi:MAG: hypothetical protein EAZ77_07465 [Nostocales cyanobacterium]|nr:MAG: hypothetical protein EAZ77_07465 [Nostocales cyanobacterium]